MTKYEVFKKFEFTLVHSIVTYRVLRVTKMTGSSSDDRIYDHLGYNFY
jgi:hypothetical protein